jgi:ABC-type branched-subunit amino acid transport system substrate-binding protein
VERAGGKVVASILHPQGTHDFSSDLLRLQNFGAQVIGLANAGSNTINFVKQAQEFGLTNKGIQLAGLFLNLSDVRALGLAAAHGLLMSQGFYWDLDDGTRAFASLLRPPARDAEPRPGRRLLRGYTLPQGGAGCRDRQPGGRRGPHARHPGR